MSPRTLTARPSLGAPCPFPADSAPSPLSPSADQRSGASGAIPAGLDPDRLAHVLRIYERQLRALVARPSLGYVYGLAEVPAVVTRMRAAFAAGTFSMDGHAVRGTCRALGLRPTRRALLAYLHGAPPVRRA